MGPNELVFAGSEHAKGSDFTGTEEPQSSTLQAEGRPNLQSFTGTPQPNRIPLQRLRTRTVS